MQEVGGQNVTDVMYCHVRVKVSATRDNDGSITLVGTYGGTPVTGFNLLTCHASDLCGKDRAIIGIV